MKRKMAVMAGAAWLALAASGCSTDGALSGPERAAEGRRVAGRLTDVIEVRDPAGQLQQLARRDTAFTTHVRRGEARAGADLVASVRGARRPRLRAEFADSASGRRHTVEADRLLEGAPFGRLRTVVDGQTLVEVTRDWRRVGGLWVLDEERATVHVAGRQLLVQRRTAGMDVAAAGPLDGLARARRLAVSAVAPGELVAAQACWKEALEYAASVIVLAAASELVIASPEKIAAALVWLAAWDKFNAALYKYAACMDGSAA